MDRGRVRIGESNAWEEEKRQLSMLSDDVELRHLVSRYRGLCRPVHGDLAVFFEHVVAARHFARDARAAGYLIDLAGTEAYIHGAGKWGQEQRLLPMSSG